MRPFASDRAYPRLLLAVPQSENRLRFDALAQLVLLGLEVEQSVIRDRLDPPDLDPEASLLKPAGASRPPPGAGRQD